MVGPRALFVDGDTLWIALREGHSVWRMDLNTGTLAHVAGTGEQGYTGDGGPAREATFDGPKGIAVGAEGEVYVVDTENQAIRMIDTQRGVITTIAGSGPDGRGFGGDGGPATAAKMDRPHGICVGADRAVYVGDTNNHRVRRVWWGGE
jgi:DNA-binding beta-propeller fold protein YncE